MTDPAPDLLGALKASLEAAGPAPGSASSSDPLPDPAARRVQVFPATANTGGAVIDDAGPGPFTTPDNVTVHDGTPQEDQ